MVSLAAVQPQTRETLKRSGLAAQLGAENRVPIITVGLDMLDPPNAKV